MCNNALLGKGKFAQIKDNFIFKRMRKIYGGFFYQRDCIIALSPGTVSQGSNVAHEFLDKLVTIS